MMHDFLCTLEITVIFIFYSDCT